MIERIAVNPKIHFGKPRVAGTRITVQNVIELLDAGLSFDEIIRDYSAIPILASSLRVWYRSGDFSRWLCGLND